MHSERLHINDLPMDTVDAACDGIADFTVGLERVMVKNNSEDVELIGTGTLVIAQGLHCILTAQHVLVELRDNYSLGLLTSFTGGLRRHVLDRTHIKVHHIARGTDDSVGPDIGLIVLPSNNIGNLLAEKVFYNLDKRHERFADAFLEKDQGFWFTCGIIGESKTTLPPQRNFARVIGYQGLCGRSTAPREYEVLDFDYLEVRVEYAPQNPDLPWSFGGCSGGGIWQVPMLKTDAAVIKPQEFVLSGVVFYQTAVENGVRLLRCHGRKTVYRNVLRFLADAKNS